MEDCDTIVWRSSGLCSVLCLILFAQFSCPFFSIPLLEISTIFCRAFTSESNAQGGGLFVSSSDPFNSQALVA